MSQILYRLLINMRFTCALLNFNIASFRLRSKQNPGKRPDAALFATALTAAVSMACFLYFAFGSPSVVGAVASILFIALFLHSVAHFFELKISKKRAWFFDNTINAEEELKAQRKLVLSGRILERETLAKACAGSSSDTSSDNTHPRKARLAAKNKNSI